MPLATATDKKYRLPKGPAYRRIEQALRERIQNGLWMPGVMLPGRRHLAIEFGVSLSTLEQAVAHLLADGTLQADGGRGTFVSAPATIPPGTSLADPRMPLALALSTLAAPEMLTIGVVVPYYPSRSDRVIAHHWPVAVVHALERTLSREPHVTVIGVDSLPAGESVPSMKSQLQKLLDAGANAFVFVLVDEPLEAQRLRAMIDTDRCPVVFVGSNDLGPAVSHIYYDSLYAGYHAARHLVDRGYRDLMFLSPFDGDFVRDRLRGAMQLAAEANSQARVEAAVIGRNAMDLRQPHAQLAREQVAPFAEQLAGRGIIASNDNVAYGIMEAASAAGLTAGRDYAIIGFDDEPKSRVLGLTTMHPPLDAMGVEAGRIITQSLRGHSAALQIRLHSYLIPRTSTAKSHS